jgi:predicted acylesterase/phospholipase RssA
MFQALTETGVEMNWISGVSIGAINAAVIAGNGPERRLKNLEAFWTTVSWTQDLALSAPEATVRSGADGGSRASWAGEQPLRWGKQ